MRKEVVIPAPRESGLGAAGCIQASHVRVCGNACLRERLARQVLFHCLPLDKAHARAREISLSALISASGGYRLLSQGGVAFACIGRKKLSDGERLTCLVCRGQFNLHTQCVQYLAKLVEA